MASLNPQSYARLREEQDRALQNTEEQIKQWEKYKSDYQALQERISTLPDKLSQDVMVPFGSVAFCPGRLVHTNEILVLLGDDWFAMRSAKQAAEIISRRMATIDRNLKELGQQRDLLLPRKVFTEEIHRLEQGEGDAFEIKEEFDPEAEKVWREKHRASVQRQRQEEAREREKKIKERKAKERQEDEVLWARLNALERLESERREMDSLEESPLAAENYPQPGRGDNLECLQKESEAAAWTDSTDREHMAASTSAATLSRQAGKRVQWQDLQSSSDSSVSDYDDSSAEKSEEETTQTEREGGRPHSLKITFSHSKAEGELEDSGASGDTGAQVLGEEEPEIRSPRDIYRLFCQPKSILKQTSTETEPSRPPKSEEPHKTNTPEKTVISMKDSSAFRGTVVQRQESSRETSEQVSQPAKISRFRAQRKQKASQHAS